MKTIRHKNLFHEDLQHKNYPIYNIQLRNKDKSYENISEVHVLHAPQSTPAKCDITCKNEFWFISILNVRLHQEPVDVHVHVCQV